MQGKIGRPRRKHPEPHKRRRPGAWSIYWFSDGQRFDLSVGDVSEDDAEGFRREVASAFVTGAWPAWAIETGAVWRYLRQGQPAPSGDHLQAYDRILRGSVGEGWASTAAAHVREFVEYVGIPVGDVRPSHVDDYLAWVRESRSVATRNRKLVAVRRFFGWLRRSGVVSLNPCADFRALTEERSPDIVYCTRAERDRIVGVADGLPGGLSVRVAFWTGLRRSEIARLEKSDLHFDSGQLAVRKSKTKVGRYVPLSASLAERLRDLPDGRIVPEWPTDRQGMAKVSDRLVRGRLRQALSDIPGERVSWNAFRHTFGSLCVQPPINASLDQVASWMGNSPEVCRLHYARFVPRGGDQRIDLL